MRTNLAIATIMALTFTACESSEKKETTPAPAATAIMPVDSTKSYDIALVNNKKDPACGMPVTAGIADTAHYKTKYWVSVEQSVKTNSIRIQKL